MLQKWNKKIRIIPVQMKASFWFLISSFLQKGITALTTPIFTRLLSPDEYGVFNVFNSWLGIISVFITLNLSYAVYSQGLIKFSDKRDLFSSSLQGLTLTMVFCWTAIYLLFREFWNHIFNLTTVQMLAMLVMIWTTAVFNFWAWEQRVLYKYKALVIITLLISVAKPLIGVIFVILAEDKVTARILGLVLVELIGYTGLFIVQMKRGKKFFSARFWKYALMYNLPLIPHYLSQTVLSSADRIMIKDMVGESEAGIYSLAYSISLIMTLFSTALMQTISPFIYQKIKDNKIYEISNVAYISLIFISVVNLILILFAPEVIKIFAPKEYYEAIWVIPPVAMSVFFMYSYDLFAKFAFYYEKTTLIMSASVVGAILNLILNHIFIGIYGYIAAGYTTLVCYLIYTLFHYILMNAVCKKYSDGIRPYRTKVLLIITIPFLLCGFLLLITYSYPFIRYGIIAISFIGMIIFREKIINILKQIIAVKKEK